RPIPAVRGSCREGRKSAADIAPVARMYPDIASQTSFLRCWPQSNLAAGLGSAPRRAPLASPRFYILLQHGGEHVELLLPVLAVAVDPNRHRANRVREETASADATGALLLPQPGPPQPLDVPGHRLQGNLERGGELGHEQCLVTQPLKDRAPDRIREREKNTIEHRLVGIGARVEQRHD